MSQNKIGIWWAMLTVAVVAGLLLSGCGAEKPKVYRVGVVSGTKDYLFIADDFVKAMTELGYKEGENITYLLYDLDVADGPEKMKEAFSELVADEVDLIFTFPTRASLLAKEAAQGTDIPVVFAMAKTEGTELVEDVRAPGGNITGVRSLGSEMLLKRFDLLHEIVPEAKRVWITYDLDYPPAINDIKELKPIASAEGITLVEVPVESVEDLQADLEARTKSGDIGIDAILLRPSLTSRSPAGWALIRDFAAKHKLAIASGALADVDQGAVLSYDSDNSKTGKLAASLVDKIFKGTPAGTIPVLSPETMLYINYKRAQELGLMVPEGILSQADEVIR